MSKKEESVPATVQTRPPAPDDRNCMIGLSPAETINYLGEKLISEGVELCRLRRRIAELESRAAAPVEQAAPLRPLFHEGQFVHVNNERFHGFGTVQYQTDPEPQGRVGVLLENGNTWDYPTESVTPADKGSGKCYGTCAHKPPAAIEQARPQPPTCNHPRTLNKCLDCGEHLLDVCAAEPAPERTPSRDSFKKITLEMMLLADRTWDEVKTPSYLEHLKSSLNQQLDVRAVAVPEPPSNEGQLIMQRDWVALLTEICKVYGILEPEWDDADIHAIAEEFDPWNALKEIGKKLAVPEPAAQQESAIIQMLEAECDHAYKRSLDESNLVATSWEPVYNTTFDLLKKARKLRARQAEPAPTPSRWNLTSEKTPGLGEECVVMSEYKVVQHSLAIFSGKEWIWLAFRDADNAPKEKMPYWMPITREAEASTLGTKEGNNGNDGKE